jgi:hypothetical protein
MESSLKGVTLEEETPMLDQMRWIKITDFIYTLVDSTFRVVATVGTSFTEDDEKNQIWEVEIEGDIIGSYVSLFRAMYTVQRIIVEHNDKQISKTVAKKTVAKEKKSILVTKN